MEVEIIAWLKDIEQAITEIERFISGKKNFFQFQRDVKTRKAVERNIEIIGEAVKRIVQKDANVKISHARKIIDTRNRITHAYDAISQEIIWAIVVKDLPHLKTEIHKLLKQ